MIEESERDKLASIVARALIALALCMASVAEVHAQTGLLDEARPLWHSLEAGSHGIGFRLLNVVDEFDGSDRVVRLAMWYPAEPSPEASRMRFADYLEVAPDAVPDQDLEAWMSQRDRESLSRQFFNPDSVAQQAALMAAPVPIGVDAPVAEGAFPLVLHSLGRNGNQYQHTILWEYLASHGYVVVSVAQFGKDLGDPTMAFSVRDLSYQLRDMEAAIAAMERLSFVDARQIAVLGHSSGAIVALWLAAGEPRVRAVVGLDGSVNRSENHRVFKGGLEGREVGAPFLNICRWPHDEYYGKFAEHLSGAITRVGFERAIHFDFQNWPAYQAFAGGTEPSSMAVRTVEEAKTVFVSTAAITRLFLDAQIKSDRTASATLRDAERIRELSRGQASLTLDPER